MLFRSIDKRITILKGNENTTLLNAYIKGISSVKSEFVLFLEEDSILLPNFNDIYEKTKLDNKDINEYIYISNLKSRNTPFSHKRNKTEYFNTQNNLGSSTSNTQNNNINDTNTKKLKNNYINKILTKKVNSRNYQENLKNLNLNYRP